MNQAEEIQEKVWIKTTRRDDGGYDAWRVTDSAKHGRVFDPIPTERFEKPIPYGESVIEWADSLNNDELEAAVLIFTDRWTWDTGEEEDRICLEALEKEREWRKEGRALDISQMPTHTHALTVQQGRPQNAQKDDLCYNPASGEIEQFDGNHWHPAKVTTANCTTSVWVDSNGIGHNHQVSPQFTILPAGGKSTP